MKHGISRRNLMISGAAAAAGAAMLRSTVARAKMQSAPVQAHAFTAVSTPNGVALPFKMIDGVKVFHLIAGEFDHEIVPGLVIRAWGYNGRTPGPTIEALQGDRVRIYVTNTLPEPTTIHWHGLIVPSGMDGVSGLSQPAIPPGQTFRYEFELVNSGTHMYHSHFDEMVQIAMGMMGMFIVHPRQTRTDEDHHVDRDFAIMLGEWRIEPGHVPAEPAGDDGLQRADDERAGVSWYSAACRAARPAHAHSPGKSWTDGSSSDSPSRVRVSDDRNRRRTNPAGCAFAGKFCAGGGGADARQSSLLRTIPATGHFTVT